MTEETALIGWEEIARFLGWKTRKAKLRRKVWSESGVIFYTYFGRPPNRRRMVCAFPSILQRYIILTSTEGKMI